MQKRNIFRVFVNIRYHSGFSFGSSTSTASNTAQTKPFSFGQTAATTAQSTGFSFGQTATTTQSTGFNFGNKSFGGGKYNNSTILLLNLAHQSIAIVIQNSFKV